MTTVMVSGGFDPIHEGHVRLIRHAARYGDVIVAVNSDDWLTRKKGKPFMCFQTRRTILEAMKGVIHADTVDDRDGTVCEALRRFKPDYFANGGDRTSANTPELDVCKELGIVPLFGIGGGKINSSSDILFCGSLPVMRPWGSYRVLHEGNGFKVKIMHVLSGKATSMQRHAHRNEAWVFRSGEVAIHNRGSWHQLRNPHDKAAYVVEVQTGTYFGEDDIERKETDNA